MKGYKGNIFRIITVFKSSEKIIEYERNLEREIQTTRQRVLNFENEETRRKLKDEKKSRRSPKTPVNKLTVEEKRAKKIQNKKNQDGSSDDELESNISPTTRNSIFDKFPHQKLSEEQRLLKESEKQLETFKNALEKVVSDLKEYLYEADRENEEQTNLKQESKYETICNKYDVDPNIGIQAIQSLFSVDEEYRHTPSYETIMDNGGEEYFTHLPKTDTQEKITLSRYSKNISLLMKDGSPRFIELRNNGLLTDNDIRFLAQLEVNDKPPEEERIPTLEEQAKINLKLIDARREESLSPLSLDSNSVAQNREERPFFICYALLHHMTRKKLKFNIEESSAKRFLARDDNEDEEEEEYSNEIEEKIAVVNYTIYSMYASEYVKRYIVR
jgi:hypothetical protein